jgi:hypothetical protein
MSSQDSWPCQTVEQFLRLCNWEGKLPERPYSQKQESFRPLSWQCQTVENFFIQFNWSGRSQQFQPSQNQLQPQLPRVASIAPQNTLKCLSVKEFFIQCNWHGRSQETSPIGEQLDPYARLKQSVCEFFQFVPWEGQPEIGKLPSSAATTYQLPISAIEPKFSDLSDLF